MCATVSGSRAEVPEGDELKTPEDENLQRQTALRAALLSAAVHTGRPSRHTPPPPAAQQGKSRRVERALPMAALSFSLYSC